MKDQEQKRAEWRAIYARQYPVGFKRRRNAEQTERQLIAQRRYMKKEGIYQRRRLQRHVRQYLEGKSPHVASMVGCTPQEFQAHLEATMSGAQVLKWHLSYRRHPREFNLDREADRMACFHYSNMYARPVRLVSMPGSSQYPSQQAPSQVGSSRAVLSAQV